MSERISIDRDIAAILDGLRDKLGVRARTLGAALAKARHRLPRRIYRQGLLLARAEPLAAHPRLRMTLDTPALNAAAREITEHLEAIDLADRRKGWWLGMLGALVFNLILMVALLIVFLRWRGFL